MYEEAFTKMKRAAGVSSTEEVVARYSSKINGPLVRSKQKFISGRIISANL